jgi:hypothetical protein
VFEPFRRSSTHAQSPLPGAGARPRARARFGAGRSAATCAWCGQATSARRSSSRFRALRSAARRRSAPNRRTTSTRPKTVVRRPSRPETPSDPDPPGAPSVRPPRPNLGIPAERSTRVGYRTRCRAAASDATPRRSKARGGIRPRFASAETGVEPPADISARVPDRAPPARGPIEFRSPAPTPHRAARRFPRPDPGPHASSRANPDRLRPSAAKPPSSVPRAPLRANLRTQSSASVARIEAPRFGRGRSSAYSSSVRRASAPNAMPSRRVGRDASALQSERRDSTRTVGTGTTFEFVL